MTKMEKISASMFFTVVWSGLCQALGWFFGLFGYKRDGKYAKCVWGLFATSAAIIMAIVAIALVWSISEEYYNCHYRESHCVDPDCSYSEFISENLYYHNFDDGKGYIFNGLTGKKVLRNIKWIAKPNGKDSLICFSDGKKRGYFNKKTGEVAIKPKYDHAWIFSDGLASVEEGGYIKFIDATGKVVIDKRMPYIPDQDGYVFHRGYCIVRMADDDQYGLMDKAGKIVLPMDYNAIEHSDDEGLWQVRKGNEMAVFDKDLNPVLPFMECKFYINEGTIDATMPDHTLRKYDLQGHLINDFYIANVRPLAYEKDEIQYRRAEQDSDDDPQTTIIESFHPQAVARLRAYVAGDCYEGLMTADGHLVTMPLYKDIDAIGPDLYLCSSTNYDKVIVNGKGEIVK